MRTNCVHFTAHDYCLNSKVRSVQHHSHRFCVAPMMDWTDRHCRVLHRLLTRHALLYTEMITAEAILHGDRDRLLGFSAMSNIPSHCNSEDVRSRTNSPRPPKSARAYGYDEINLNVGCPSDRVRGGRFGACLMAEPELVAAGIAAMRAAVSFACHCQMPNRYR